ncbi:winged helix DNA-binding domain-containing protein, partial [Neoconidiobolus thromboides FSU 785]
ISWDVSGDNILIHHIVRFELEVLPIYFDSSRMDSFSRQLNLYGFKRVSDGRKQRSGPLDRGCMFNCPFFKRDRPDLCHLISRKKK